MLTSYDIEMMGHDIREVINMWGLKLTILKPLPIAQQTNWNEQLHEYSGAIKHDRYINVVAERKDQQNMAMYGLDITTQAGDLAKGMLIFTLPNTYTFLDETCRISYDNEQWRIHTIKERIGENIIFIEKLQGNTDTWDPVPSSIVDVGGDYNA
jgi:hypothetical protein